MMLITVEVDDVNESVRKESVKKECLCSFALILVLLIQYRDHNL